MSFILKNMYNQFLRKKWLDHTPENLSQHFTVFGCRNGIKEQVFIQHIEALQILSGHVLQEG